MKKDKYCKNCEWTPESKEANYCELCGSELIYRYCAAGCEFTPSEDDNFCPKCGTDLLPLSKKRVCSELGCKYVIPKEPLPFTAADGVSSYQIFRGYDDDKNTLCYEHFFEQKGINDWRCLEEYCWNYNFRSDLCLNHYQIIRSLEICESKVRNNNKICGRYYDPFHPGTELEGFEVEGFQGIRFQCIHCNGEEGQIFYEEYLDTYYKWRELYSKKEKQPGFKNNQDMSQDPYEDFYPINNPKYSQILSLMKEEIYILSDQNPPYEVCIRCGKNNLPTSANYCMRCLRSTKEYARHSFVPTDRSQTLYGCVYNGYCGLCFDSNCKFNKKSDLPES